MWDCQASYLRESPGSHSVAEILTAVFRWANEICTDDNEERALVLAVMNTGVQVVATWLPLIVWQQIEAPRYHKGFVTASCMGGVAILMIVLIKILQDKETKYAPPSEHDLDCFLTSLAGNVSSQPSLSTMVVRREAVLVVRRISNAMAISPLPRSTRKPRM